jgi:hypothetical protein
MIKVLLDLLSISPYYRVSETVDIAKGKYQLPRTFKQVWETIKRRLWRKKRSK